MKMLPILAVLLAAGTAAAVPVEWPISEGGNGHYYEFVPYWDARSWWTANAEAASRSFHGLSGHLLTVNSEEEESWFVANLLYTPSGIYENRFIFIGGWFAHNVANDGGLDGYQWITGEPFNYESWPYWGAPSEWSECVWMGYFYMWGDDPRATGFHFHWEDVYWGGYIIEFDGLPTINLPPLDPVSLHDSTWGGVKALFR